MQIYQHILVAVDFFEHTHLITERAKALAQLHQASLGLIHVVDNVPMPDPGYGVDMGLEVDLTNNMMATAKTKLGEMGAKLGIAEDRLWVELGAPKYEVTRVAEENHIDLIIVGSHGRHGLALLMGSSADGVLHHAKCDVLAVRLPD